MLTCSETIESGWASQNILCHVADVQPRWFYRVCVGFLANRRSVIVMATAAKELASQFAEMRTQFAAFMVSFDSASEKISQIQEDLAASKAAVAAVQLDTAAVKADVAELKSAAATLRVEGDSRDAALSSVSARVDALEQTIVRVEKEASERFALHDDALDISKEMVANCAASLGQLQIQLQQQTSWAAVAASAGTVPLFPAVDNVTFLETADPHSVTDPSAKANLKLSAATPRLESPDSRSINVKTAVMVLKSCRAYLQTHDNKLPANLGMIFSPESQIVLNRVATLAKLTPPTSSSDWYKSLIRYVDEHGSNLQANIAEVQRYYCEPKNGHLLGADVRMGIISVFDEMKDAWDMSNKLSREEPLARGLLVSRAVELLPGLLSSRVKTKLGFTTATTVPSTFSYDTLYATTMECVELMLKEIHTNQEISNALVVPKAAKAEDGAEGVSGSGGGNMGSGSGRHGDKGGISSSKKVVVITPAGSSSSVSPSGPSSVTCYNCNRQGHIAAKCDKPCKNDGLPRGCDMGADCKLAHTHTRELRGTD